MTTLVFSLYRETDSCYEWVGWGVLDRILEDPFTDGS